jgi:hypothetical protein
LEERWREDAGGKACAACEEGEQVARGEGFHGVSLELDEGVSVLFLIYQVGRRRKEEGWWWLSVDGRGFGDSVVVA